jgi:hypothetical protein
MFVKGRIISLVCISYRALKYLCFKSGDTGGHFDERNKNAANDIMRNFYLLCTLE